MTPAELKALADQIEDEGPNRRFDAIIRKMLRLRGNPAGRGYKPYTASFEAATTLLEQPLDFDAIGLGDGRFRVLYKGELGYGSLAQALCAAALRAQAQEAGDA
jgi:hypothetical protein